MRQKHQKTTRALLGHQHADIVSPSEKFDTCMMCGKALPGFLDPNTRLDHDPIQLCRKCRNKHKKTEQNIGRIIKDCRRKEDRYRVKDIVFITKNPKKRKKWQLLDIGMGGLSFRYIGYIWTLEEISALEIVTKDKSFSLSHIPIKKVFDSEMAVDPCFEYSLMRRGVQFGRLTRYQKYELTRFINSYAAGKIPKVGCYVP
jgi:hypothetical protein